MTKKQGKPGPAAERLKIEGDWENAVAKMLAAGPRTNVLTTKKKKGRKKKRAEG